MIARVLLSLALCSCVASAWPNPAQAQRTNDDTRVSPVFTDRVRAYVAMEKGLEGARAAQTPTTEAEQIADRQDVFAAKIATARRGARQGDIFTPDVAGQFRAIIRDAFRGSDGRNMRRTIQEGDPERPTVLQVNVAYPEDIPLGTMPPMLLSRFPALPAELAYRIIGRALVLKDVTTNLIVDFIPDAMPQVR